MTTHSSLKSKLAAVTMIAALAFACESDRSSGGGGGGGGGNRDTGPRDSAAIADATPPTDGSSGDTGFNRDAMTMDAMPPDTGVNPVTVPDPGNLMGVDWADVEPNNTAAQATPVGILSNPAWLGFGTPMCRIMSNTDVDFYVFKTNADPSGASIQACWSGNLDLMDMFLYDVNNSQLGAQIKMVATTNTACETLIPMGMGAVDLMPNRTYVVEFRPAPGLNLGANTGLYNA